MLAGLRQARGPGRVGLIGTRQRYVRFWGSPDMADYPPRLVSGANDPLPPSAIQSSCVAVFLSSALSRIDVGTSRPSALAVVILSTVSYFTDSCTGRSAGFPLLRMRST